MRKVAVEHTTRIKKAIPIVKEKIGVGIFFKNKTAFIKGEEIGEYLAEKVLRAVDFGFDVEDALLLRDEDYVLEFLNIKDFTRRKNLEDVRARVIGTKGKAKRTLEELSGAIIEIRGNVVGVISDSEHLPSITQAIKSIIQGTKHGNVFGYLERRNARYREIDKDELGIKKEFLKSLKKNDEGSFDKRGNQKQQEDYKEKESH